MAIWRQKVRSWAQIRQDVETQTISGSWNPQTVTPSVKGKLGNSTHIEENKNSRLSHLDSVHQLLTTA